MTLTGQVCKVLSVLVLCRGSIRKVEHFLHLHCLGKVTVKPLLETVNCNGVMGEVVRDYNKVQTEQLAVHFEVNHKRLQCCLVVCPVRSLR